MASTNVYIGEREDINILYEEDISVSWTFLNSNNTAYDFSNKTDSDLNIYDYNGGTLEKNYGENATEGLSYASNVCTLNSAWPNFITSAKPGDVFWYVHTYEDSGATNPTIKLTFGVLKVK